MTNFRRLWDSLTARGRRHGHWAGTRRAMRSTVPDVPVKVPIPVWHVLGVLAHPPKHTMAAPHLSRTLHPPRTITFSPARHLASPYGSFRCLFATDCLARLHTILSCHWRSSGGRLRRNQRGFRVHLALLSLPVQLRGQAPTH